MAKNAGPEVSPEHLTEQPEDDIAQIKPNKKDHKKDKEEAKKKKDDQEKKGIPIVLIAVLLALALGISGVLVFDVMGIRNTYLMPYLRNAPLLGRLLPLGNEGSDPAPEQAPSRAVTELNEQITLLEYEIDKLEADLKAAREQNANDTETIRILRTYEALMDEYREKAAQFDEMIALGDPNAYAAFYASVAPENAERIYQQVMESIQYNTADKKLINIYTEMSEDSAAEALEQLLTSDAPLVAGILQGMDATSAANILNEMSASNRAVVTRLIAPTPVPERAVPTAPVLDIPEAVSVEENPS